MDYIQKYYSIELKPSIILRLGKVLNSLQLLGVVITMVNEMQVKIHNRHIYEKIA